MMKRHRPGWLFFTGVGRSCPLRVERSRGMAGGSVFCQNGPTRRSLPRSVGGACRHLFEREDSSATDDEYGWQRVPQREQETGSLNTEIGVPRDLLDQVVAYFHPRRAIMFGSRARGKA